MAEIEAREGVKIGKSQLSKALRKKTSVGGAPAHAERPPDCRRDSQRVGLRLQLRKAQAEAGDIILCYGDESEALTHPYLARAWALRGADLRVLAPGQAKKVAIIGSLDHVTRQLIVHTGPDQAQPRLYRSPRATRPSVRSSTRTGNKTGRTGRGQRADPCQQAHS